MTTNELIPILRSAQAKSVKYAAGPAYERPIQGIKYDDAGNLELHVGARKTDKALGAHEVLEFIQYDMHTPGDAYLHIRNKLIPIRAGMVAARALLIIGDE